jgi:hypothetical protein
MAETLPATVEQTAVMDGVTADALTRHVKLIGEIQKKVMVKDRHYGVIPGTGPKPTLLKPGAELLAMTFRLCPVYEIVDKVERPEFLSYTVCCTLETIESARRVATGIASCNSYEKKYRYRWIDTGDPVPKEYWKDRDPALIGGKEFKAKKNDAGAYTIHEYGDNDNPYDLQNTLIKMAEKRALIAAILNATAASDYFTQDIEDFADEEEFAEEKTAPKKEPEPEGPPSDMFMAYCDQIAEATDGDTLTAVGKECAKAHKDGKVSPAEYDELKARGKDRRKELTQ